MFSFSQFENFDTSEIYFSIHLKKCFWIIVNSFEVTLTFD